jgi:serine protein kinase
MTSRVDIVSMVRELQDVESYRELTWEGSFQEYVDIVSANPKVCRSAFQRVYDMILSYGTEEYTEYKKRIVHYKFFDDPIDDGRDAVYGLDIQLMKLVNIFKAAARRYGTERRVILLHGPVGSSKSTIARLLKKGLEQYSRTREGALYTFHWIDRGPSGEDVRHPCPMHEEPLHLVPGDLRPRVLDQINSGLAPDDQLVVEGDLCPFCRRHFEDLYRKHGGDWTKVIDNVRVTRLVLSEKDRIGIGTFQPKDEKNQDSTELTGDINYRKIAEYGTESDPRAFNFDGEFNIANRGLIEFVEVLKLDVAFLYDLLGASQEHKIKPKKFAQTDIDEVILGHSVAGGTPIPYRFNGRHAWTTMEKLYERFLGEEAGLEVLAHDFETGVTTWTPVRRLIRHPFTGRMLTTTQKWGAVETTPNHSVYGRDGKVFFPEEARELMAARRLRETWGHVTEPFDVTAGVEGFIRHDALVLADGGPIIRPPREGWARLDRPRSSTAVRTEYHPLRDHDTLRDLITVLVWYATEGHRNGGAGVVISQNDPTELERVRQAAQNISTAGGSIDEGAKTDNVWRLTLGSEAMGRLLEHHCGRHSINKRLPDFLFRLPEPFLRHAFNELMRTDGSRKLPHLLKETASADYQRDYFEYRTISPMLAAQVGTLASLLGMDYSIHETRRGPRASAWRVRFVSGEGKRGGRHHRFTPRLFERDAREEWVYDIECAGLHNFVCGVGNVVCHNSNEPEYRKLQKNEYMEALRDRTIKIDVPYITKLDEEIKIYLKDYNPTTIRGKHIAPHSIEMAAMWAVLTRLEEPKKAELKLMQKLKLYTGKSLPGFTEDNVRELRKEAVREGMNGISPRYVQDKISNALVNDVAVSCINPFMILNELESGLKHHSLIANEEERTRYRELLSVVKDEYENVVKNEVQRAISADEDAITKLCANYIDNIKAYTLKERVRNKYTGQDEEPDERLMRSIEEKVDIPEGRKDDFRREIMNYIGALAVEGKTFDYKMNARLHKALEGKLFEDQKDSIKLTSLVSSVVDRETQEKIDIVKSRLIKNYGYCDVCSTDVLHYVASIFARGDTKS